MDLSKEDKDLLRLLVNNPGFKLYVELLRELAEAMDRQVHNSKNWDMHIAAEAKYDLLVTGVIPLLDYTLQEEEEET